MRQTPKLLSIAALGAAMILMTSCFVAAEGEPGIVTASAGVDYTPMQYEGSVVYYDDVGRPYYYLNGAVVYVPIGSPYYRSYVAHYHRYRGHYWRWYNHRRTTTYRRPTATRRYYHRNPTHYRRYNTRNHPGYRQPGTYRTRRPTRRPAVTPRGRSPRIRTHRRR